MSNLFKENFLVYRIANTNLYAAIPNNFLRFIREYVIEYKSLESVPADKSVKGILFKKSSVKQYELADQGFQKNIPVNRLQFNTDDNI